MVFRCHLRESVFWQKIGSAFGQPYEIIILDRIFGVNAATKISYTVGIRKVFATLSYTRDAREYCKDI